jgi:subtilisin-like proprotein convertase family protein
MSVQTWGEDPSGTWKLEIFPKEGTTGNFESFFGHFVEALVPLVSLRGLFKLI